MERGFWGYPYRSFHQELFIARQHAYVLEFSLLKLTESYCDHQKQKQHINNSFNLLQKKIANGVLQCSVLGYNFFQTHLIETRETANNADDTTLHTTGRTVFYVKNSLEMCAEILFKGLMTGL